MKHNVSEKSLRFFPIALILYEISHYLTNDAYLPAMPIIAEQLCEHGGLIWQYHH